MDTTYAVLIFTGIGTTVGFLVRQALSDRDKRLDDLDKDLNSHTLSIRALEIESGKQSTSIANELRQLERLSDKIDEIGEE